MTLPFHSEWFLRLAMAVVFLYHGLGKRPQSFAKMFNLSYVIAVLVIFAEVSGGLGYLWGGFNDQPIYYNLTFTQLASLAVIPVLLGAIIMVHAKNGFNFSNNGYEFQLVLLAIALYFLTK